MEASNEKFIKDIMSAKGITKDEAIERCVNIIRVYCGGSYDSEYATMIKEQIAARKKLKVGLD